MGTIAFLLFLQEVGNKIFPDRCAAGRHAVAVVVCQIILNELDLPWQRFSLPDLFPELREIILQIVRIVQIMIQAEGVVILNIRSKCICSGKII